MKTDSKLVSIIEGLPLNPSSVSGSGDEAPLLNQVMEICQEYGVVAELKRNHFGPYVHIGGKSQAGSTVRAITDKDGKPHWDLANLEISLNGKWYDDPRKAVRRAIGFLVREEHNHTEFDKRQGSNLAAASAEWKTADWKPPTWRTR